jgi:hypothetical protein
MTTTAPTIVRHWGPQARTFTWVHVTTHGANEHCETIAEATPHHLHIREQAAGDIHAEANDVWDHILSGNDQTAAAYATHTLATGWGAHPRFVETAA